MKQLKRLLKKEKQTKTKTMGDFSGPMDDFFKVVGIGVVVIIIVLSANSYFSEKKEKEQQEKEKSIIYEKGRQDALKVLKIKIDSINKSRTK